MAGGGPREPASRVTIGRVGVGVGVGLGALLLLTVSACVVAWRRRSGARCCAWSMMRKSEVVVAQRVVATGPQPRAVVATSGVRVAQRCNRAPPAHLTKTSSSGGLAVDVEAGPPASPAALELPAEEAPHPASARGACDGRAWASALRGGVKPSARLGSGRTTAAPDPAAAAARASRRSRLSASRTGTANAFVRDRLARARCVNVARRQRAGGNQGVDGASSAAPPSRAALGDDGAWPTAAGRSPYTDPRAVKQETEHL